MFFSKSFIPILKNNPSEAKIKSHQLMLRVGMIKQSSAGIYSWLPLGFKVMKKIEQIVREEQDRVGVQEILMPTIQSSEIWKESGRYEDYGEEMLRIKDRQNREMLYGPTNEELVTEIFRSSFKSYKSLPQLLYHIQWKFRDELRPRFGIMRCREFYMKDAYSFDLTDDDAIFSYNKFFLSYLKTFKRLNLSAIPMAADTGPIGGNLSHEFIILADTGESKIYTDKRIFEVENAETKLEENSLENLIEKVEESIGPISVAVFNLGSQIGNRSLFETSDKVFERGWRMATLALFRTAKKLFPYMEKRGGGTLLVTSSTAAVRGNKGQHSHAASMGGRRMLCQTLNAEFSSKGIHTTHIIIDGAVDAPDTLGKMLGEEAYQALRKEKGLGKDGLLLPDKIAETYYHLADQHRSAWTHEVDLRAYNDDPWWNTPRNIANSI